MLELRADYSIYQQLLAFTASQTPAAQIGELIDPHDVQNPSGNLREIAEADRP